MIRYDVGEDGVARLAKDDAGIAQECDRTFVVSRLLEPVVGDDKNPLRAQLACLFPQTPDRARPEDHAGPGVIVKRPQKIQRCPP